MSKELSTLEFNDAVVLSSEEQVTTLDNLSLALVGGGEGPVAL